MSTNYAENKAKLGKILNWWIRRATV